MVYNLFFMLGGVVAMLFGMKILGSALEKVAGGGMKTLLGKVTDNRLAGVGVGVVVTSIIQSSTATTVMLVGFVNIGLLSLAQASGVIMGANIGTTITAHIVSLSGVGGAVDVGAIAAMIGFIGIMISMLTKKEGMVNLGNILAGLGMIFVGLEFISIYAKKLMFVSDGVPHDIVRAIFQGDHFPLLLVLIGIVLTALVHSSSTITSLMVVLASIGVLAFDNALFLALGSNIGTCITSVMSSIGTCTNAKRTAVVHLLFNLFGCCIFIAPIWIWREWVVQVFSSMSSDVGQQIAIFHTLFNVATTIILFPLNKYIVKLSTVLIPEKKVERDEKRLAYLDDLMIQTPTIAVGNIRREVVRMAGFAKENLNLAMEMLFDGSKDNSEKLAENEDVLNYLNHAIITYMTKVMAKPLSVEDDKKISSYFHVVSDLERVGDYAENIMEYALRLKKEELSFSEEARGELNDSLSVINQLCDVAIKAFDERNVEMLASVEALEQQVDDITVRLEEKHVERVKKGACAARVGSIYLHTISNLERVGDHITNVAQSLSRYRKVDKQENALDS